MKALDRAHGAGSQDDPVPHGLHRKDSDALLDQFRHHEVREAPVVGIHNVERHLNRIKLETPFAGQFEHVQVNSRVFVAGKADVAKLARLTRLDQGRVRTLLIEDSMRVFEPDDLMVLDQVDPVSLQAPEGLVQLSSGLRLRPAIDLSHQEYLVPVPFAEGPAHPDLAGSIVVVPGVVHEVNASIDRGAYNANGERLIDMFEPEVPTAEADG